MDLSIIIVNWNTKDLLKKCIESVFRYSKNIDCELIVVDNASSDGSQEIIEQFVEKNNPPSPPRADSADARFCQFTQSLRSLRFIQNRQNLGFAKAVNQGIKLSKGEYILLLNPDTEIKEGTLQKMIEFMENHPKTGISGGKILNPDSSLQPSVRTFPDLASQSLISLKVHHFIPTLKVICRYFARDFDYTKTQEVDQVMGAFFMTKRKLIDEIGLFDEKFFLWFEEVDFCQRAKKAGWQIYYFPEVEVIHQRAASFRQVLPLKNQWQFNKSLLYYFKKHHSFLSYVILLLLQPLSLFLSLVVSIFHLIRKFKKL